MCRFMTDALNRLRNLDCISVSIIDGPAVGGGAELTTATDFRVISEDAYICFIHARRNLTPGWGGGSRLVSIIGRNKALRLLAAAEKVSPQQALSMGLVDKISSKESLAFEIENFVGPFLDTPLEVLRDVKHLVAGCNLRDDEEEDDVASLEEELFCRRFNSKPFNSP